MVLSLSLIEILRIVKKLMSKRSMILFRDLYYFDIKSNAEMIDSLFTIIQRKFITAVCFRRKAEFMLF